MDVEDRTGRMVKPTAFFVSDEMTWCEAAGPNCSLLSDVG